MGKASSSKKVARAAKAGGRTKVRRQSGLVFPISLVLVLALGLGLIVYARHASRNTVQTPPTTTDHWHEAYGFYICNAFKPNITNANETQGSADYDLFRQTGIHTHGDGVIHVHPYSSAGTGKNAKLGTWFKQVGVKLTNTSLELPKELGSTKVKNGDDCQGKPGKLQVTVWDNVQGTGDGRKYISDFNNLRFTRNGMGFTIAFVPDDVTAIPKPPSAANLAALGAVDSSSASTTTTVAGATATTAAGDSSTTAAGGSSTTSASGDSTTTAAGSATTSPTTVPPTTSG